MSVVDHLLAQERERGRREVVALAYMALPAAEAAYLDSLVATAMGAGQRGDAGADQARPGATADPLPPQAAARENGGSNRSVGQRR